MKKNWRFFLRFSPDSWLRFIKRHTSSQLRLKVRQRFGASHLDIPNEICAVRDGRRFRIGPDLMY